MVAGGGACMVAGRGSVHGCWQGRHAWLLVRGHVWLLGGVRGCWGAGMVAYRGACVVAGGGGVCGCWWGACVVAVRGDMHGCWWGAA